MCHQFFGSLAVFRDKQFPDRENFKFCHFSYNFFFSKNLQILKKKSLSPLLAYATGYHQRISQSNKFELKTFQMQCKTCHIIKKETEPDLFQNKRHIKRKHA